MSLLFSALTSAVVRGVEEAVKIAAIDVASDAVDGLQKGLDDVAERRQRKKLLQQQGYIAEHPEDYFLIIQKTDAKKDCFRINDQNGNEKYYVKGIRSEKSAKVDVSVYDLNKCAVGSSKNKLVSLRAPVIRENMPGDYSLIIHDTRVATLKTKLSVSWEDYEIEPFGWQIKLDLSNQRYTVYDGEVPLICFFKSAGYKEPTYIMGFTDEANELIGLLTALTIICRKQ